MGHFGRGPIRLAWFAVVLPALLLNYFGQGALLLAQPERRSRTPSTPWCRAGRSIPLVVIATVAAVDRVAGADLGRVLAHAAGDAARLTVPRLDDRAHVLDGPAGQIYMPEVNWLLMVGCVAPGARLPVVEQPGRGVRHRGDRHDGDHHVLSTWSSRASAGAGRCGAWPLLGCCSSRSTSRSSAPTWPRSRTAAGSRSLIAGVRLRAHDDLEAGPAAAHGDRCAERRCRSTCSCADVARQQAGPRVPGTAVFLTSRAVGRPAGAAAPPQAQQGAARARGDPVAADARLPPVPPEERLEIRDLGHGVSVVVAHYGFMETPDMHDLAVDELRSGYRHSKMHEASSSSSVARRCWRPASRSSPSWRKQLLHRHGEERPIGDDFFGLPPRGGRSSSR